MKSPKFQIGDAVKTVSWWKPGPNTPYATTVEGVVKHRYYISSSNEWHYIIQPVGTNECEEAMCGEGILELWPVKVLTISPGCCCNCPHSKEKKEKKEISPKFHKEQRVKATKDGVEYLGHINRVIDMKTSIDYYVITYCACCGELKTLRCPEEDITACNPHCPEHCIRCYHLCDRYKKKKKMPPPKFHIGQRVRTTFEGTANHNHCGTVIEVIPGMPQIPWFYKVKMCPKDKCSLIKGGVRHHGESLFEAVTCFTCFTCCCCCCHCCGKKAQ